MTNNNTITLYPHKAIVNFEGKDFFGQIGIDSRIFNALQRAGISVGVISQQAIENGISVLVDEHQAESAVHCLREEFQAEIYQGVVSQVSSIEQISVIGLVTDNFNLIFTELQRNKIFPLLLNQVAKAGRVNLVVATNQTDKAINIIKSVIQGKPKTVHLVLIGHGTVGGTLVEQILDSEQDILRRKGIKLKMIAIANSQNIVFSEKGFARNWRQELARVERKNTLQDLFAFVKENQFENLILVDNTASKEFPKHYSQFAENGFDIVSSNKVFNTWSIEEYRNLRKVLEKNKRRYLYETNVGAGLPLIDTIKLLHLSGENITRIKGVFSGSLSYIFNNFSVREERFSKIIEEAMQKGFTEPDPREDLSGNDVARKLLILARELDLVNEFEDIRIQNLIPQSLVTIDKEMFMDRLADLDEEYEILKKNQESGHVLRYVGDLHGDLSQDKGAMDVKLVSVPAHSALGQLKGSDSIFEIYTESYGENPIVIMGAGAGAAVTARGVFGDILRLSERNHQ